MLQYDSNEIATNMSPETYKIHMAILHDPGYVWDWVQEQATMVWNGRTTVSGHTFDNFALTYDLGQRIEKYVRASTPAFTADLWNDIINWFFQQVDWYKIAEWHFTNMWEGGEVDGWQEEMSDADTEAGLKTILDQAAGETEV